MPGKRQRSCTETSMRRTLKRTSTISSADYCSRRSTPATFAMTLLLTSLPSTVSMPSPPPAACPQKKPSADSPALRSRGCARHAVGDRNDRDFVPVKLGAHAQHGRCLRPEGAHVASQRVRCPLSTVSLRRQAESGATEVGEDDQRVSVAAGERCAGRS